MTRNTLAALAAFVILGFVLVTIGFAAGSDEWNPVGGSVSAVRNIASNVIARLTGGSTVASLENQGFVSNRADVSPNTPMSLTWDPSLPAEQAIGGPVNLSMPEEDAIATNVALPANFPKDWEKWAVEAREEFVTEATGIRVTETELTPGFGGTGYSMNAKDVESVTGTCPVGFTCHLHLVDDRIVFFQGHDEAIHITDGIFRVLAGIPSTCENWFGAYQHDTSLDNVVFGLGLEVTSCGPIPEEYLEAIDPGLGEYLEDVESAVFAPVNTLGHIADGYGLFQVYAGETGSSLICASGFACLYSTDEGATWSYTIGSGQSLSAYDGAFVIAVDDTYSGDECNAIRDVTNGIPAINAASIVGAPTCP